MKNVFRERFRERVPKTKRTTGPVITDTSVKKCNQDICKSVDQRKVSFSTLGLHSKILRHRIEQQTDF